MFDKTLLEKKREEIRAVVAELEDLELSDDWKLARNYLFIWANELIKVCSYMVRNTSGRMKIGDRFRYRGFIKANFPTFENSLEDFFAKAGSFRKNL